MTAPAAVYVRTSEGICSGRGLKMLCERLTDRGFAKPGTQFEVFSFYEEFWITTLKCVDEGKWEKLVPAHWEPAFKPRRKSYPLMVMRVDV